MFRSRVVDIEEVWLSKVQTNYCPLLVSRPTARTVQKTMFLERNNDKAAFSGNTEQRN